MKILFRTAFALFLSVASLSSCSNDGDSVNPKSSEQNAESVIGDIPVNLKKFDTTNQITLFGYTTVAEAVSKSDAAFADLITEAKDDLGDHPEATDVYTNVKVTGGKAYVAEILYFDSSKDEFTSGFYYDDSLDKYVAYSSPVLQSFNSLFAGRCPQGYTELASCSNLSSPEECISSAISNYMSNNLSSVGDCTTIYTKVGLTSTRVCGKKC